MAQISLSLDPDNGADPSRQPTPKNNPVMGKFAVGFGLLGVFTIGVVFVPIGLVCSLIALFSGQATWGFVGLMLAVMGLLTSPHLLLLIGLGAFSMAIDWNELFQPFMQHFDGGPPPTKQV